MIPFLTYLLIGVFVLAYQVRIRLAALSEFNRKNYSEDAWGPAVAIAVFWPVTLPALGVWKAANKVLDKFMKV